MKFSKILKDLGSNISGATAVEYGLILALIFLAMLGAIQGFGVAATDMWNNVSTKMVEASN
jgi:pilus assembly protein Flp/PilA